MADTEYSDPDPEFRERDARNQQAALWLLMAMLPCMAFVSFAVVLYLDVLSDFRALLPEWTATKWFMALAGLSLVWLMWCAWHLCRAPANPREAAGWWDVLGCTVFLGVVNAILSVVFAVLAISLLQLANWQ